MTIEELDDPNETPPDTGPSFAFSKRIGRLHAFAVAAGVLVGVTVVAAVAPPQGLVGDVRASGASPLQAAVSGCSVEPPDIVATGPVFVALADQGQRGVAFLISAENGAHRGRIVISGSPQAALDTVGGQLLVTCDESGASHLVSYDLRTLRERWRAPIADRQRTKAPGDIPALAVSLDGDLAYVMHYRTLRAGDANAPGASRHWLSAFDAHSGKPLADVELPECGVGSLHATPGAAVVLCRDGLRVIDTDLWLVKRTLPVPGTFRPVGLIGGERFLGVTRELRVVGLDLSSGVVVEDSEWSAGTPATANAWGRLAVTPDGCCIWVLAKGQGDPNELGPDFITYIDLEHRKRVDLSARNVRGVGVVGARLVYVVDGFVHSTGGSLDTRLFSEPVDFWQILGPNGPLAANTEPRMSCQPTTTRDASGVITLDGKIGIVGETFTNSGDGSFLILRRGAVLGEIASLQFTQIGTAAPATWVQYSSTADPQASLTPWGDQVAFAAGWKPIAFESSCWRLIVDGTDSGLVLGVGP